MVLKRSKQVVAADGLARFYNRAARMAIQGFRFGDLKARIGKLSVLCSQIDVTLLQGEGFPFPFALRRVSCIA